MEHWRAELGETFHASVYGPGELVFISDPESLKRRDGIRREHQRKTQLARVSRTLEDANAPAGTLQCDARSEPSDTRTDNQRRALRGSLHR